MSSTYRTFASASFLRVTNMAAAALVSLLIMPFVIHKLGDRLYGVWALVATFVGYYGLFELGLSPAVVRFFSKGIGEGDEVECNRVFNTALRIYSALAVVALGASVLIAFMAPWITRNTEDATLLRKLMLILGVTLAIQFPSRVFTGVLQAYWRYDRIATLDLLSLIFRTTLVIAVLLAGYKVLGMALAALAATLPSLVLSVHFTFKEAPFLRIDSAYWRGATAKLLFSFSGFSLIIHLSDLLRFQVDNFVVATFVSLAAVTHYRIGGALGQYFYGFMEAFMGSFIPVFSRKEGAKDYEGIRRILIFTSRLAICGASFIAFGMIAWGKPFIARWVGPQYLDAYPVLVVLVLSYYFALAQAPGVNLIFGMSKHKLLALLTLVEGLANLGLSIVLARKYGMIGVAVGTLIPITISKIIIQPIYVCRVAGMDYFKYVRRMGRTLAHIVASLLIPLVIAMKVAAPDYKHLFLTGILSTILYALSLWFLEFTREETRALLGAILPQFAAKGMVE
jgi:O-antigen/teichoic acid export membrane protein